MCIVRNGHYALVLWDADSNFFTSDASLIASQDAFFRINANAVTHFQARPRFHQDKHSHQVS